MCRGRADRGQATIELALVLPVLALFLMAVAQVIVVGVAEVRTVHAAREGARAAAVGEDPIDAVGARSGLSTPRTSVRIAQLGEAVTVSVSYRQSTDIPLIGALLGDVVHTAEVTMRSEEDP